MKIKIFILFFTFISAIGGLHSISIAGEKTLVEQIAIEVTIGSCEFVFTNKQTAFYYGEIHSDNKSPG
jgi:hypothetical protein